MSFADKRGFTLVELTIVITIVALLIAGVLKGQEIIQNARVLNTAAQIKAYDAAVTSFRYIYKAMPGDMRDGMDRIPDCNLSCNNNTGGAYGGAEDGIVGRNNWGVGFSGFGWATQTYVAIANSPQGGAPDNETSLFWVVLMKANLITGVTDTKFVVSGTKNEFGITHPAAKVGGGWVAGFGDGVMLPGQPSGPGVEGMMIALMTSPGGLVNWDMPAGKYPLQAVRAAQLDAKMDDGYPVTGHIRGYGIDGGTDPEKGCFATVDGVVRYSAANKAYDCGLVALLQQ